MSASTSNIGELEKPETGHAGIISQNFPYPQQRKADVEKDGPDQETAIEMPRPEANEYPKGLTLFFLVLALSFGTFVMALDNVFFSALSTA